MEIEFEIVKYSTTHKAGDVEVHKIHLKNIDGHSLILRGSRSIKKGYPLGETVIVSIQEHKTLDKY